MLCGEPTGTTDAEAALGAHGDGEGQYFRDFGWTRLVGDEAGVGRRHPDGKLGRSAPGRMIFIGTAERGGGTAADTSPCIEKDSLRKVTLQSVDPNATGSTERMVY